MHLKTRVKLQSVNRFDDENRKQTGKCLIGNVEKQGNSLEFSWNAVEVDRKLEKRTISLTK